jgi:hypothetical protein
VPSDRTPRSESSLLFPSCRHIPIIIQPKDKAMPLETQHVPIQRPPIPVPNPLNLVAAPAAAPLNLTAVQVVTSNVIPPLTPPSGHVTQGGNAQVRLNPDDFQTLVSAFQNPQKTAVDVTYDTVTRNVVAFG